MGVRLILSLGMIVAVVLAQEMPVIRTSTRLVQVDVVVRDSKGSVGGLSVNDFRLFDNGKPQKISVFSVVGSKKPSAPNSADPPSGFPGTSEYRSNQPISATIFFINNLAIEFSNQIQSRQSIAEIVKSLPSREPIAVYKSNLDLVRVADFTRNHARISEILSAMPGEQPRPHGPSLIPPVYAEIEELVSEVASLPGRKNLIWVADFFPVAGKENLAAYLAMMRTVRAVNAANVAIYPIAASGVFGPPAYSAAKSKAPLPGRNPSQGSSGLDEIFWADQTGGIAAHNTDPGMAAKRAMEDAGLIYSLGFYPETAAGTYHELTVKVDRKNADVRSRQGYVAAP